jgi:hypothetical protein
LQEFLVSRQHLGDQLFEKTLANVQAIRLDCWVILSGFDETGTGHVLSVETPGYVTRHDIPGCFAIGSGTTNATVSLYFRGQDYTASLTKTAYQVYEAKACASVAPGVGPLGTKMMVLSSKNESVDGRSLTQTEIDALDAIWRAQSSLPTDLDQRVSAILSVN